MFLYIYVSIILYINKSNMPNISWTKAFEPHYFLRKKIIIIVFVFKMNKKYTTKFAELIHFHARLIRINKVPKRILFGIFLS